MKQEISPSGGNKVKTLEEFKNLCVAEYTLQEQTLIEEFKGRKAALVSVRDNKIKEYEFINSIISLNTAMLAAQKTGKAPQVALTMAVEEQIALLSYETMSKSFPIDFWRKHYGEQTTVILLSDIMYYFLSQFEVKEKLKDVQIMQFAVRLLASQPRLKFAELIFIFNNALQGKYGPTYQRIGIDSILGWINTFLSDSCAYLEGETLSSNQNESRGDTPWREADATLKKYEQEQKAKKRINDRIWAEEKRKTEVQEYKEKLEE